MNGAGKKVWGYYPTTDTWIPLQVDENGKVVVDMSGISLGDLGDTWLPAPGDQYFLYWDDAAGKWDCRILVDADIPASIARDAEVDDKIAAHHDSIIKDADGDTSWDVEEAADEDKVHGKVAGAEFFLGDNDGVISTALQTSAKGYRVAGLIIPNDTWTKIPLDAEDWDTQNNMDITVNNRFDVTKDGIYLLEGQIRIDGVAANAYVIVRLWKNGAASVGDGRILTPFNGASVIVNALAPTQLVSGDFVELQAYQNTGGGLTLFVGGANNQLNHLIVHKIA